MAKVTRVFPYVDGRQIFTMPGGYAPNVQYHCWGGGGAGGGDSGSQLGGNGSAGVYTTGEVFLNKGDQIEVIVGGGGGEGRSIDSNKKLFSMTLPGQDSSGVGATGAWGYVNDPTQAVYPWYDSWASPRAFKAWSSFMNQWAVSDIPTNRTGTEEFNNPIYFPEAGAYDIKMACDNVMEVWFRDQSIATMSNNFKSGEVTKTVRVSEPGIYDLRYRLTNAAGGSGNPAGAAIVVTRSQPSYMGGNGPNPVRGVIWSTRFGRSVDVSDRVMLYHAPLVPFYRPQRDAYDWGGFPDGKSLAFISATSTWSDDELAKLNLSFDQVITIGYSVTIKGWGRVDQYISTGYYTFKRGQTWKEAQYAWSGNQKGTWENNAVYPNGVGGPGLNIAAAIDHGSGTPSCWTEKQFSNDNAGGRKTWTESSPFANWELPVPPDDAIYIVGFDDGQYFTSQSQRGSSNLQWQVNSRFSQTYAGGAGGESGINVADRGLNYYGGYGGQIGDGKISGGGGGGGGASLILQRTTRGTSLLTVAGGGAGGGGAGSNQFGDNGRNEYETYTPYPNSAAAGQVGKGSADSGGGGGGGGGGTDGGRGGAAAIDGVGSRGDGGWQGGSQVTASSFEMPKADFVMIGRGGNGGGGGGGGGAGDLLVGQTKLLRTQYIQVGGRGDAKFEGGVSAIWYSDTDYIAAGPGGEGGNPESQFAKNGNGQAGGCKNADTNTNIWGGSGGGAGTRKNKSTASGGPGKSWSKKPSGVTSYSNSGGNSAGSSTYAPGGGGGVGGAGSAGNSTVTNAVPGSSTATYNLQDPNWSAANTSGLTGAIPTYLKNSPFTVWLPDSSPTSYSFYLKLSPRKTSYYVIGNAYWTGSVQVGNNTILDISNNQNPNAKSKPFNVASTGYYKVTITAGKFPQNGTPIPWYGLAVIVMDGDLNPAFAFDKITVQSPGIVWCTLNSGSPPYVYNPGISSNPVAQGGNGGNGGAGRTVALGSTGRTYTLGGGGGAAAGYYNPGVQFAGLGTAGAGDGAPGGDPAIQWSVPGTYSFRVPRGVTSIRAQGVGGGGSGGGGGQYGNGGGGSGGYIDATSVAVVPGQTISVLVGQGGVNGNGGDTIIQFPSKTFVLTGGKQASSYTGGDGGSPNGSQGEQGKNGDAPNYYSGSGASSPYGEGGQGANANNKTARPGVGGTGAGGGGGWSNSLATVNGGLGGAGFVRLEWNGVDTTRAVDNTGSGGGGGFDGGGGEGGTGFVVIAYAGEPLFNFTGENYTIQQNGYTIHECYSSGDLVYNIPQSQGRSDSGGGISPAGQGVNGYISGTAVGGVGQGDTNVYPIPSTQAYPSFLNTYGVWNSSIQSTTFDRTYTVYFPETVNYEFKAYVDNGATVKVDGKVILDMTPNTRDNGTYWWKNGLSVTRTIPVGNHTITINATSPSAQGAFAMTILKSGTTNPFIFNSRNPPVVGGSAAGGNGLVILEFQGGEGTAQIKVDNAWRRVTGQWVKVGGVWKVITDSSVKVGGAWASLFGASPISVSIDTTNFGGPATPVVSPSSPPPPPPPTPKPDPGPKPRPKPQNKNWFYWISTGCANKGWGEYMRDNAVWQVIGEVNNCSVPDGTKYFFGDFYSFGGIYKIKWAVDDSCDVNLIDEASGTIVANILSGNNQRSPTTRIYTLPVGTIKIQGSVTNDNRGGLNPAGIAMEIMDSDGFPVWSTGNLL